MNKLIKVVSLFLVGGGSLLLVLIFAPVLQQEISYQVKVIQKEKEIVPVDTNFGLVIPKIRVNARVFPEVDSQNPQEYLPLLTQGVAHALGSGLPGQEANLFIFAHSTDTPLNIGRYNAVFYLLGKLQPGDEIWVFYESQKHVYLVTTKKVVAPAGVADFLKGLTGKTITLQTCTPPGTTLNRLLVVGKEKETD